MNSVDEIINTSAEVREVKRAISVKMLAQGLTPQQISELLNVSLAWISKWRSIYTAEGATGLCLQYQGSPGYLTETERRDIAAWIAQHETLTVEAVRDYVETQYGITYQSKQSYYDLLTAGGLSHHRSEPVNPKRDEVQVQAQRAVIKKNWQPFKPKSSKAS